MRKIAGLLLLATAVAAHADVTVSDADSLAHRASGGAAHNLSAGHQLKPGEKSRRGIPLGSQAPQATGSQALIDASGVKYFINTNITFSTSSSASAAMSEASYTHAVAATTMNGGTVMSTLNDAYDGYNTLCLSLNNTVATCQTGNANFVIYNKNGPATTSCSGREVDFPVQTAANGITLQRSVYVPSTDSYARWNNVVTNTGATPQTVTLVISNNLGSDSNTVITGSSSGGTTINNGTQWVTTFQNYSGTTSSDPRLGHVFAGPGAQATLAGINFADGDDNPFWGYTLTLQPGQTRSILNFAVVQPSKAAAATKAASLVNLPAGTLTCLTQAQQVQVANFNAAPIIPEAAPGPSRPLLALLAALLAAIGVFAGRRLRASK